jgi:hypothetical protein
MLAELDVVVFLKLHDDLDRAAERVFGALGSQGRRDTADEWGGDYAEATGLGFSAVLFSNAGEVADPEFEHYQYGLEITSQYWCVDLDTTDLDAPLSEYFSRMLAFDLDIETATEILVDTTEESEIFEIRSFRRNPQYRLDQAPTTPKVFIVETRQVEEPFEEDEDELWEADEGEVSDAVEDEAGDAVEDEI